jgi:alpha-N-arabinofuranosidase
MKQRIEIRSFSIAAIMAAAIIGAAVEVRAAEIHVAVNGKDANVGTPAAPLRTIQRAAEMARPGDVVTVHAGVYRERISPPRGGESDAKRITYQAAPGEKVEIKGSEVVKDWVMVEPGLWKVTVPNSLFGAFNPFSDLIRGDWFEPKGREHHTGAVYLDGEWLAEAAKFEDLLKPGGPDPLWFAKVDKDRTTIWAEFNEVDPNEHLTEVNVRKTVFYPEKTGVDYLTVRGFVMRHAATNWAPPTAEQVGLIGTNWSKGWIIEKNTISHSVCSGIALGKHGDEFDNTSKDTAEGYVKTIERALARGWSKDHIGGHIVRDNAISHCEQTGIVGSMGAAFSTVTGNTIHDIHVRQLFTGAEMAGIKLHAAIDVVIGRNHIYRTVRGLWLDWMAQGTRVTGNLFHDNPAEDLFMEVDHGPFLVDNNVFLSPRSVLNVSQGGAYVHNLMAGEIRVNAYDARQTPFHKAHSTELLGMHDNPFGDDKFLNNVFAGRADLSVYDKAPLPVRMEGNVFLAGAKPSKHERTPVIKPAFEPGLKVVEKPDGFYLEFVWDKAFGTGTRRTVTTALLGKAAIPDLPYEQADGQPIRIDTDFFDKQRKAADPTPGPFENPGAGRLSLEVWKAGRSK